jgi:hypothetical protein
MNLIPQLDQRCRRRSECRRGWNGSYEMAIAVRATKAIGAQGFFPRKCVANVESGPLQRLKVNGAGTQSLLRP